jgi:hypothetical protein
MKISTNNIGNYSINLPAVAAKNAVQKKEAQPKNNELSVEEKKFFIDKYPQRKSEIVDYHFYQKGGAMSGVKIGQLFDKKG